MNAHASLFGIERSNRNFADPYYWGKNQFNSAFPVALACYMHSRGMPLVYVQYKDAQATHVGELGVDKLWGSDQPSESLYFSFETRFDAFRNLVHDDLPPIDLVVCAGDAAQQIRPLEVKLTTLPDNTTEALDERQYGAELVIRSATTRYMALSMAQSVATDLTKVRSIFEPVFARVRNWDSKVEMKNLAPAAVLALETFLNLYQPLQQPLLMQPLWKTVGKSSVLAEQCLDIFVWSDFALAHLFLESARHSLTATGISRPLRAALRLSRFLFERASGAKVYQQPIYDGMTFDFQNDKEFAISGMRSRGLMACERLHRLAVSRSSIRDIVLGGGHTYLSPERRFDAILYFSTDLFEVAP